MNLLKSIARIVLASVSIVATMLAIIAWPSIKKQEVSKEELPLINRAAMSVYMITDIHDSSSGGTGFQIMTTRGPMIVTNSHVCDLTSDDKIRAWQKDEYWDLKIIEQIDKVDLCILKGIANRPYLELGKPAKSLDKVTVIGHPHLMATTPSQGWVIERAIIELRTNTLKNDCQGKNLTWTKKKTWFGMIETCIRSIKGVSTNVPVSPGNSGSPVINKKGLVVGVIFATNSFFKTAFYVPIGSLRALIKKYELITYLESED